MRVSARTGDIGNIPGWNWAVCYLDGKLVDLCITADEETRTVIRYARGANGHLVLVGDALETITETGDVTIAFRADAPDWVKSEYPNRVSGKH